MTADPYLRHPHISGDVITFVAEDCVWVARLDDALRGTATARRLVGDGAPDGTRAALPRLNSSATRIAWTSVVGGTAVMLRGGTREVWCTDLDGGQPEQLTYWGDSNTGTYGWLSDTDVLVRSGHGHATGRRAWMFAVPVAGPPRELPCGPAADLAVRGDGAQLVGTMTVFEPAYWKRYRGGCAGRVWYSPDGDTFEPVLGSLDGNVTNPVWAGSRMAFLSDHEGVGALYSAAVDGADLRRHGDLGPFYARNAASDGTRVVYEQAGRLFLLASGDDDRPVELGIRLADPGRGRLARTWSGARATGGFVLDPTGRRLVAEVRGTLHLLPAGGGEPRVVFDVPGARARLPVATADAVVCVSDQGGEEGIDVLAQDGSPTRRLAHGQLGRVRELVVAPDGRSAALATDARLLTLDLTTGALSELVRSDHGPCTGLAFSPGSDLLAWAQPWMSRGRSRIRIARAADGRAMDVTCGRFQDRSPVFTLDGRHLAFLSSSTFDPTVDGQTENMGFAAGVRPHLVPLDGRAASPFDASHGGWLEGDPSRAGESGGSDGDGPRPVDLEGLPGRVVPFPVEAGAYDSLVAIEGGVAWMDRPSGGLLGEAARHAPGPAPMPRLVGYRLADASRPTLLAKAVGAYSVAAAGGHLAYRAGGAVHVMSTDPATGDDEPERVVDLAAIQVRVDPQAEWRQMFDESWRLLRDRFWRADLDGVDWPALGARYRPLLDRIGSSLDLFDVIMEMQSELSVSHVGVFVLGGPRPPASPPGFLGADLVGPDPTGSGEDGWRIGRLLTGDISSAMHRTPLAGPGMTVRTGDVIAAVDGVPVDPARGPLPQLAGKAGQQVKLTLGRDGAESRLVVVPTPHEPRLRHHDLTVRRRAQVAARTDGRVGYLRMLDMVATGWADLHRDLSVELERTGLILDLRGNGGGDLHPLLDMLTRRVTGWHQPRYAQPYTWPYNTVRGPVVVLIDEFTTCGPENLVVSLQRLGAATLVGRRTHGSMTGSIPPDQVLLDGSRVSQPTVSKWWDGQGWLDGHGVTPDVEVDITPQDWVAGRDPQLGTAIDLVLDALRRDGRPTPPDPGPVTGGGFVGHDGKELLFRSF